MEPFQGTIRIARGRILSLEHNVGGVRIISDHHEEYYPGCWATAGLVDSHAHIFGLGIKLLGLNLYATESAEECAELALRHDMLRGDWITGMGWNQENWEPREFPSKKILDDFFPDTPVYLSRVDGHAAWLNSEALRRAGIDAGTKDPFGGKILRDRRGEATGILLDTAMDLALAHIPPYSLEQQIDIIRAATAECVRVGLTEVHDMDVDHSLLPIYREMAELGQLPIRVHSYVHAQNGKWAEKGILPAVGEFHYIRGVKYYADGALGSRGAWLLEPYSDAPDTQGLQLISAEDLFEQAKLALELGWHISTHAIGDAANRMVLDVYERLRKEKIADEDSILRIEHAQIVHPDDQPRFNRLKVHAAVQPIHFTSDAAMAEQRLGAERLAGYAYPWRSLRNNGITFGGGSDFPIESHDPVLGIHSFCRADAGEGFVDWHEEETITRQEALLAYTMWAHELSDSQYRRGMLEPKFDADLTIFDQNILANSREALLNTRIVATYTAGVRRYHNEDFHPHESIYAEG